MKKSIILLGMWVVFSTNISAANFDLEQQNEEITVLQAQNIKERKQEIVVSKPKIAIESPKKVIEAASALSSKYVKNIEDLIIEDKKITELKEEEFWLPIYLEKSIDDIIKEDEQIIEKNDSSDFSFLNYEFLKVEAVKEM